MTLSSGQELAGLIYESRGTLVKLTGPLFPSLTPTAAALVLMCVALRMPKHLRIRTMHLGVNLLQTGDWSSEILAAARNGDPLAQALADAIIANARRRPQLVALSGGVIH